MIKPRTHGKDRQAVLTLLKEVRCLLTAPENFTGDAFAKNKQGQVLPSALNPYATQWCIIGAICKCASFKDLNMYRVDAIEVLDDVIGERVFVWQQFQQHEKVLIMLDKAIKVLEDA